MDIQGHSRSRVLEAVERR